ncbi:MAG: hypothetical protein K0B81_09250 [Candidatus Cloacimonetes bacterium]|nr:hypothetical protein [Candidatus Cloacimonadota bacterium]
MSRILERWLYMKSNLSIDGVDQECSLQDNCHPECSVGFFLLHLTTECIEGGSVFNDLFYNVALRYNTWIEKYEAIPSATQSDSRIIHFSFSIAKACFQGCLAGSINGFSRSEMIRKAKTKAYNTECVEPRKFLLCGCFRARRSQQRRKCKELINIASVTTHGYNKKVNSH